jgi:hypothetical protein
MMEIFLMKKRGGERERESVEEKMEGEQQQNYI